MLKTKYKYKNLLVNDFWCSKLHIQSLKSFIHKDSVLNLFKVYHNDIMAFIDTVNFEKIQHLYLVFLLLISEHIIAFWIIKENLLFGFWKNLMKSWEHKVRRNIKSSFSFMYMCRVETTYPEVEVVKTFMQKFLSQDT